MECPHCQSQKIVKNGKDCHQNVDISTSVRCLVEDGHKVDRELLSTLSPYLAG
jgi:hypothetical protein